jgi:hypothetical protein
MKDSKEINVRNVALRAKWILPSSLVILIIGCIGYFGLPRGTLIFYIFAHLGALGLLGLIGGAAGILARRKGRSYSTAFFLGSVLPVAAGLVAVVLFAVLVGGRISCGGSVSLATALIVVASYSLMSRKVLPEA